MSKKKGKSPYDLILLNLQGQPWDSFADLMGRDTPLPDENIEEPPSSIRRLPAEDMPLYGLCPGTEIFTLVVCEICNASVKPCAFKRHIDKHKEEEASSETVNFPPPSNPSPIVKPTVKVPYCTVSKSKKTRVTSTPPGTKFDHATVRLTVDQAAPSSSALSISSTPQSPGPSTSSSPVKSPGTSSQPRRKKLKTDRSQLKDREYDPNRHCGVWIEETGKHCLRSITCKIHSVSSRRTVAGRSKSFDKLLAEHRAAKELNSRPTKVTFTGTITVSSASSSLNPLAPNTPVSTAEPEGPSSPPVLSLPDTYPLPKAVDLLYRCLAPHGSTKPTKLEEDFANEELRTLESTLTTSNATSSQSNSIMAPISVMLPSLSPLPGNGESSVATLISSTTSTAMPVIPTALPTTCMQPPVVSTVLENENPMDIINSEPMSIYSPVYKDINKSQLVMQIPRQNSHAQSPVLKNYQLQASMPSLNLFDPMEQLEQQHASQINGKRLNHMNPMPRQQKRHKHDYQQDFSTAIQIEATTTASPYPYFGDISWSNCHPEPLAVSRWLRISSSRKQYNFNIH